MSSRIAAAVLRRMLVAMDSAVLQDWAPRAGEDHSQPTVDARSPPELGLAVQDERGRHQQGYFPVARGTACPEASVVARVDAALG